jgi:glycosyltransferase involved in cell wall biosynthesis
MSFVERGVPGRKPFVNPYGVNLGQFRRLPKRDHVFRVVFAGVMSLRKGVHYLIKAFAELRLAGADYGDRITRAYEKVLRHHDSR